MSEAIRNFAITCILYWIIVIIYGILPGFLIIWILNLWFPIFRSHTEGFKYFHIIFGICFLLILVILWVLVGFVTINWFILCRKAVNNNYKNIENGDYDQNNKINIESAESIKKSNVKNGQKEMISNETVKLKEDNVKCYNTSTEKNVILRESDIQKRRSAFRSKSCIIESQDMWEDDFFKLPSGTTMSLYQSSDSEKNNPLRISHQDSYQGLPEMNPFDNYLHLAALESPLTARERFFIDLIKSADDKAKAEALEKINTKNSKDLAVEAGSSETVNNSKDLPLEADPSEIASSVNEKLNTIHEVSFESEETDLSSNNKVIQ